MYFLQPVSDFEEENQMWSKINHEHEHVRYEGMVVFCLSQAVYGMASPAAAQDIKISSLSFGIKISSLSFSSESARALHKSRK